LVVSNTSHTCMKVNDSPSKYSTKKTHLLTFGCFLRSFSRQHMREIRSACKKNPFCKCFLSYVTFVMQRLANLYYLSLIFAHTPWWVCWWTGLKADRTSVVMVFAILFWAGLFTLLKWQKHFLLLRRIYSDIFLAKHTKKYLSWSGFFVRRIKIYSFNRFFFQCKISWRSKW